MNRLLVYKLAIQSSYATNTELEADDTHFDTVQWWLTSDGAWRVRTFAIDNDVHLHHVAKAMAADVVRKLTTQNYEDVVAEAFEVELSALDDAAAVALAMQELGGAAALEVDRNGARFAFWNPLGVRFVSQSEPE